MKSALLCAAALLSAAAPAIAQSPSASPQGASWMRYPAISPDGKTIAFTYKGDIYKVSSAGGTAAPLTTHTANDFMPVWSHDGKQIAFASDRYGNNDIYVISAEGGEAKRLTFYSSSELRTTVTGTFSSPRHHRRSSASRSKAPSPTCWVIPSLMSSGRRG
jgi:Tol biopolymer transport system component